MQKEGFRLTLFEELRYPYSPIAEASLMFASVEEFTKTDQGHEKTRVPKTLKAKIILLVII